MAQEYIRIAGNAEDGIIALSKTVFEKMVKYSIKEIEKVKLPDTTKLYSPIQCKVIKNKLHVSVSVKLDYGANVNGVCENLQAKVAQNIYQMTNIKAESIDVKVVGFSI